MKNITPPTASDLASLEETTHAWIGSYCQWLEDSMGPTKRSISYGAKLMRPLSITPKSRNRFLLREHIQLVRGLQRQLSQLPVYEENILARYQSRVDLIKILHGLLQSKLELFIKQRCHKSAQQQLITLMADHLGETPSQRASLHVYYLQHQLCQAHRAPRTGEIDLGHCRILGLTSRKTNKSLELIETTQERLQAYRDQTNMLMHATHQWLIDQYHTQTDTRAA